MAQTAAVKQSKANARAQKQLGHNTWRKAFMQHYWLYIMMLPALLYMIIFNYLPMTGLYMAFTDFSPFNGDTILESVFGSPFAGLKYFKKLFTGPDFWTLFRNTLSISLANLFFAFPAPIILALMINELYSKRKSKVYQTMMFFPHFLSWVVVSYFVFAFLNVNYGLLNKLVIALGGTRHQWYAEAQYWPLFFVLLKIWKGTGYSMVVYLASITGIDGSLYEAAMLDGATKWQQAKFITLPMLKTVIVMMFILSVGGIFASDFGLFYQVTQGVPNSLYKVASTFDTYVYSALQSNASIGKTAAVSTFQSVACCITILTANFIVSKIDSDSAVF